MFKVMFRVYRIMYGIILAFGVFFVIIVAALRYAFVSILKQIQHYRTSI